MKGMVNCGWTIWGIISDVIEVKENSKYSSLSWCVCVSSETTARTSEMCVGSVNSQGFGLGTVRHILRQHLLSLLLDSHLFTSNHLVQGPGLEAVGCAGIL